MTTAPTVAVPVAVNFYLWPKSWTNGAGAATAATSTPQGRR